MCSLGTLMCQGELLCLLWGWYSPVTYLVSRRKMLKAGTKKFKVNHMYWRTCQNTWLGSKGPWKKNMIQANPSDTNWKTKSTCQLPYLDDVLYRLSWWRENWGIPQRSEWGQRSLQVEAEAGLKHLRRRISRCLRTYQVYRAARFWVFMGVPLLRCWERCDWFRPVTSTTSLWGMLCCCM